MISRAKGNKGKELFPVSVEKKCVFAETAARLREPEVKETQPQAAERISSAVEHKAEMKAARKAPVAAAKKTRAPGAGRKTLDTDCETLRRPISIPTAMWHTIQVCSKGQGITASELIRRAVAQALGGSIEG